MTSIAIEMTSEKTTIRMYSLGKFNVRAYQKYNLNTQLLVAQLPDYLTSVQCKATLPKFKAAIQPSIRTTSEYMRLEPLRFVCSRFQK